MVESDELGVSGKRRGRGVDKDNRKGKRRDRRKRKGGSRGRERG